MRYRRKPMNRYGSGGRRLKKYQDAGYVDSVTDPDVVDPNVADPNIVYGAIETDPALTTDTTEIEQNPNAYGQTEYQGYGTDPAIAEQESLASSNIDPNAGRIDYSFQNENPQATRATPVRVAPAGGIGYIERDYINELARNNYPWQEMTQQDNFSRTMGSIDKGVNMLEKIGTQAANIADQQKKARMASQAESEAKRARMKANAGRYTPIPYGEVGQFGQSMQGPSYGQYGQYGQYNPY